MNGTIVEIGPGAGANMRYFNDGAKVIGIEPNPHMHPRLRAAAEQYDVDYEIPTLCGERIDVQDETADGVVPTLVLCGVQDPVQVVAEAQRVLKPGGTLTYRTQKLMKRPHQWLFTGCEVDRDTTALLRDASFTPIEIDTIDAGAKGIYVRHQLAGTTVR